MTTEKPIFGFPNFIDNTFTDSTYNPVRISGGGFETARPRTYIKNGFLKRAARTSSAARTDTFMHIDMGVTRDVRLFALTDHNISRNGRCRSRLSSQVAWNNVTVSGVNALNATTLNISATGNGTIRQGDGFTIAGDTQMYQPTADLGFGENIALYSEDLSNGVYTLFNASLGNETQAPDYINEADELVEDGTNNFHGIRQDITTSGTTFSISVYMKRAKGSRNCDIRLIDQGASSNYIKAVYDFDGATASQQFAGGNGVITTASMTLAADGYYKCVLTGTVNTSTVTTLRVEFALSEDTSLASSYIGNGTSGIYLWGLQVNIGTTVLAYAKTVATAAASTGALSIERVDDTGTGLAAATTGSEAVTCHAGEFIDLDAVESDSGLMFVWQKIYDVNTLPYGHPSFWDGKATEEQAQTLKFPFYYVESVEQLGRYARFDVVDTTNSDSYISIGRVFVSQAFEPTQGIAYGLQLGRFTDTTVSKSKGGAEVFEREEGGKEFMFAVNKLPQSEGFSRVLELQREAGIDKQIFFILAKSGNLLRHETAFPCRLVELNPNTIPTYNRWDSVFKLKEVIA